MFAHKYNFQSKNWKAAQWLKVLSLPWGSAPLYWESKSPANRSRFSGDCCFSTVIGVALMVGILFFLMIAVEQTMDWMGNQMSKMFGSKKSKDPEDPAALVGSFKRYKN